MGPAAQLTSHFPWWSGVPSDPNPDSCKTVLAIVIRDLEMQV